MSDIHQEECRSSLMGCLVLAGLFVGSLYIWDSKHGRNHPSTIKKRFFSVFVVILVSPFILKLFLTSSKIKKFTIFEILGLRLSGMLPAIALPLLLTMVLFLGPLCLVDISTLKSFFNLNFWIYNFTNLLWIRNVILGPLAEEFSFRACMMPLLLQCYRPLTATYVCSLFFGVAHIHHGVERYKAGDPFKIIVIIALFQFSYTTVFGAYSAFVFFQTGHFISIFIIHSFCNVMGLPDFGGVFNYQNPKKILLVLAHIFGVVFWLLLIKPMLDPKVYNNYVYFNDTALNIF